MSITGPEETTSRMSAGRTESDSLRLLRTMALIVALAGALGSVGLTLYAGHRIHSPHILLVLFAIWVLSPFVVVALVSVVSKRWSMLTRTTLHGLMLVLAATSVAIYAIVAFGTSRPKTAIFVVVPPASWLLIAIVPIAELISRWRSRRGDGA